MKVLFLDIDGVLNSENFFRRTRTNGGPNLVFRESNEPYPLGHLDEIAIEKLNRVIEITRCHVVISSTWRQGNDYETIAKHLAMKGFRYVDRVIGQTPVLHGAIRGTEIARWLLQHRVVKFAIVDDDADMGNLSHRLVKTEFKTGLRDAEADALIELLR